jgi:hypothetical protein
VIARHALPATGTEVAHLLEGEPAGRFAAVAARGGRVDVPRVLARTNGTVTPAGGLE